MSVKMVEKKELNENINKVAVKKIESSYLNIIKQDYREMNKKQMNDYLIKSRRILEENEEYLREHYFKFTSTIDDIKEKSFREKFIEMINDICEDIRHIKEIRECNKY